MNKRLCVALAGWMFAPVVLLAQQAPQAGTAPPANPITVSEKGLYSFLSSSAVRAAEKMPEENYAFKPTPDVRSFGQLVGHVADANYNFCSQVAGEANPNKGSIEKTKTSKADLVAANTAHTNEHYGNMVTYMRLKGIVPPTSETPPPAPAPK